MTAVLSVQSLSIALPEGADRPFAVEDVTCELRAGEILCVVGESGSGKSMWANATMGLLPPLVTIASGAITFDGMDLTQMSEAQMQHLRGARIAMIFQEPMTALNPLMRVADQIAEVFEAHGRLKPSERETRAIELLNEVGIPDPPQAARAYPFQLSGGQRQRVMIAMALALEPQVLIADEPTTALDVTTQAQILKLVRDLQRERGMSVLFITHDFGVVADIADRVVVMQHGRIVEVGVVEDVLHRPQHAYTRALIDAIPDMDGAVVQPPATDVLLSVEGLTKTFTSGGGLFAKKRVVHAVSDVSFDVARGETLGIVGEFGSGKSTAGRCLVRLEIPDAGKVMLDGEDIAHLEGAALKAARGRIQMIFQDPYASLNPRAKIARTLTEGAIGYGMAKIEAVERAGGLMEVVGLDRSVLDRYPHEFSGGQRQRIGIARALMLNPEIIIADEAVSALDVSVQRQVLELLADLKTRLNLAMVFITHDLGVAAEICDRIAVMQRGKVVEIGPAAQVLGNPSTDYTRSLMAAMPGREMLAKRKRLHV